MRIYSPSPLFYWWPVWVCGFVMAIWTLIDDHRMAIVPAGTKVERVERQTSAVYELTVPDKANAEQRDKASAERRAARETANDPNRSNSDT